MGAKLSLFQSETSFVMTDNTELQTRVRRAVVAIVDGGEIAISEETSWRSSVG
jgi:hypothetical protein